MDADTGWFEDNDEECGGDLEDAFDKWLDEYGPDEHQYVTAHAAFTAGWYAAVHNELPEIT